MHVTIDRNQKVLLKLLTVFTELSHALASCGFSKKKGGAGWRVRRSWSGSTRPMGVLCGEFDARPGQLWVRAWWKSVVQGRSHRSSLNATERATPRKELAREMSVDQRFAHVVTARLLEGTAGVQPQSHAKGPLMEPFC
jgi:hypothetical protein